MKTPEIEPQRWCTWYGHSTIAEVSQLRGGETASGKYNLSWQLITSVNLSVTGGWSVLHLARRDSFGNVQWQKAMRWIQHTAVQKEDYMYERCSSNTSNLLTPSSFSLLQVGWSRRRIINPGNNSSTSMLLRDFVTVHVGLSMSVCASAKVRLCLSAICDCAWIISQIGISSSRCWEMAFWERFFFLLACFFLFFFFSKGTVQHWTLHLRAVAFCYQSDKVSSVQQDC